MKYPNFFIVGAPKCGTTALSEYLREDPNIYVSRPKEPHFFAEDFHEYRRIMDIRDYLSLFRGIRDEYIAVGEASVWYLYSSVALGKIYEFNRDAKIIVMLRNPVDMVYSLHSQAVFTFSDDESDFETSWRLQSIWKQGERIPKSCLEPSLLQYRDVAKFSDQLERLFAVFPSKQVKVILMEDFPHRRGQFTKIYFHSWNCRKMAAEIFRKLTLTKFTEYLGWEGYCTTHPIPCVG